MVCVVFRYGRQFHPILHVFLRMERDENGRPADADDVRKASLRFRDDMTAANRCRGMRLISFRSVR